MFFRESLEFAHRQLGVAEETDSASFRAEAYLNLARTHERLGALERAMAYARHSLFSECDQCKVAGHVQLCVGNVNTQLASFCPALEAFQQAHKIAQSTKDPALELQVKKNDALFSSGETKNFSGPVYYFGLPGVVLEVELNNPERSIKAISIDTNKVILVSPDKYIEAIKPKE